MHIKYVPQGEFNIYEARSSTTRIHYQHLHYLRTNNRRLLLVSWSRVSWTHRVLVVLKHLGFGFEVVCGWHRVFIPAVPLFQDVCVQPRLHSCIQDHLELCGFHLPRHSDAAVLFSHQSLKRKEGKGAGKVRRRERKCVSSRSFSGSIFWISGAG